jgi:large conductance mechanosensitive channel
MSDIIKGFKDFLLKGNIIDLAVAFVMGLAVYNLVTNFVASFIEPIVNSILGSGLTKPSGSIHLRGNNYLLFASFINAVIAFVIIAAVLYLVFVLFIGKVRERTVAGPDEPATETELDLLRQIRDGLNRP